ncbi:MAG: hypothetical protein U0168_29225 [Nannocystaceae bacterium]
MKIRYCRIGVLELVDQRGAEAAADALGQALAVAAAQRRVELQQQIVERLQLRCALAPGQLTPHVLGQPQLEVDLLQREILLQRRAGLQQRLAGVEERVARHQAHAARVGVGLLRQVAGAEAVEHAEGQQRAGLGLAQKRVHGREPRRHVGLGVLAAVQHLAAEQQRGHAVALAVPQRAHLAITAQVVAQIRIALVDHARREQREIGVRRGQAREPLQLGRDHLRLLQVSDEARLGVVQLAGPVVAHDLIHQRQLVDHQLGRQRHAGLERRALQYALAEAVDGRDGREIEAAQRRLEPRTIVEAAGPPRRQQLSHVGIGLAGAAELGQGAAQPHAHAVAQLRGCGLGEGHHQDLVDAQLRLEQQPQEQRRDRVGLAGAGAGLDQAGAEQRQRQGIERVGHREPARAVARPARVTSVGDRRPRRRPA